MRETRNMLLAAYHFPPMGGSGVQRPAKFATYLPQFGWNPIVLCAGQARYPVSDATLCDALPSSVRIERFAGAESAGVMARLGRLLPSARLRERLYWLGQQAAGRSDVPEPQWPWARSARIHAIDLCRRFDVKIVVTSGPPFSTHLIGLHVKRHLGLPWIAEFRDPLTSNYTYAPRSASEVNYWRWLEREALQRADQVVVTCEDLADDLRKRHADARTTITTITNGWDSADGWDENSRASRPVSGVPTNRDAVAPFTLRYVGAFYREQSIEPMLRAMRLWMAREPEWIGRVRLEVVGTMSAAQLRLLKPDDERFLTRHNYVTHAEAILAMCTADALYLTAADAPGGRLYIPAKTFEYLASKRPVLASIPRGTSLERLLDHAGGVRVCGHEAVELSGALARFVRDVQGGRLSGARDNSMLEEFRRDRLTQRLAGLLDEVAERVDARSRLEESAA